MFTFLITYGADNEMVTFQADSPAHAVEQFCDWAPVSPNFAENFAAITAVAVTVPVDRTDHGIGYAHASDGSYFGLDILNVTFVPEEIEDIEEYLF